MSPRGYLLPEVPPATYADYAAQGGGEGLRRAHELGPAAVVAEVREARLRGRGGAGFPTGVKWNGTRGAGATPRFVVCNAAEGEPGTFKDRWLIRMNPYQLLEGIAIAAIAVEAEEAFIGIKARFVPEIVALERAAAEMSEVGLLESLTLTIVPGPDDYLFGEEKALLEVIEGRDPLPRIHPPYVQGLFEETMGDSRPVAVNNVETLCHVPHILANGSDWFRAIGTEATPGTMVFTVGGDVRREAVAELEMGTPLSRLVNEVGGGPLPGRRVQFVANGVSNRVLTVDRLDTPLDFDAMRAVGSGLGSGGFTVYDDTVCVLGVAAALSAFLARGSCGQCPPCKLGTVEISEHFASLAAGGGLVDVEQIAAWAMRVTDANRCGLGGGQQALANGLLVDFPEHLAAHAGGETCPRARELVAPVIGDWDQQQGRFSYAGQE